MITLVVSAKGSQGVTTLALALATVNAARGRALLVEADPAGGDLAYRCRQTSGDMLPARPNILGFGAATTTQSGGALSDWAVELAGGVSLIQGTRALAQGRQLEGKWASMAAVLAKAGFDVVVDGGRLDTSGPLLPMVVAATRVLVVMAPTLESIQHTIALAKELTLSAREGAVTPVVVSPSRHAVGDLADVDAVLLQAGVPTTRALHVALDPTGVKKLYAGKADAKNKIMRSAAQMVFSVADLVAGVGGAAS